MEKISADVADVIKSEGYNLAKIIALTPPDERKERYGYMGLMDVLLNVSYKAAYERTFENHD